MIRFTVREVLLLTLTVGLAVAYWMEHRRCAVLATECRIARQQRDDRQWTLTSLIDLIEERNGQVTIGDDSVALYIVAEEWSAGPGWTSKSR